MKYCSVMLAFLLIANVNVVPLDAARILAFFYFNGKSHFFMFETLLKALAARGHQVYVVGHFPQKHSIANYTDISVEGSLPAIHNNLTIQFFRGRSTLQFWKNVFELSIEMCEKVMGHPEVEKILDCNNKYDVIITHIILTDCIYRLSHRFNAPVIGIVSSVSLPWANDRIANPDHPAYIPSYFMSSGQQMNIGHRILNTFWTEIPKILHYYSTELSTDMLIKEKYDNDEPTLAELKKRTSLILVNSYFNLNTPRPMVPPFVEVAAIHINSGGELPKDLEDLMNKAEAGVIYFSLGSMTRSDTLSKEHLEAFKSVFSELPQLVLWKTGDIPGLPGNVKTSTWFPQFEILSHPNTRALISHGGMFSTQEAVYTGVPMVGIPLFGDHNLNIKSSVSKGIAVLLELDDLTTESLRTALKAVLYDAGYRKRAKLMSELFLDRPHTALDTAVFWTEYVIKHGGAPHMRSSAVYLKWYQYLLLDVSALSLLIAVSAISIVYYITKGNVKTDKKHGPLHNQLLS